MKSLNKIKLLLEKYFEGNTSLREEQNLRDYFSSNSVDSELIGYAPLFQYFEIERKTECAPNHFSRRTLFVRSLIGVAACVALVIGFVFSPDQIQPVVEDEFGCTGTYVRIEGACYNDIKLVFSHAAQAISDLDILLAEDHSCKENDTKTVK